MFCPFCGRQIADNAYICVNCGNKVEHVSAARRAGDTGSIGWWWLGFLVPLAGLLIWLFGRDSTPNNARRAGIGALVGFIVSIVSIVLLYVGWFSLLIGWMMYV